LLSAISNEFLLKYNIVKSDMTRTYFFPATNAEELVFTTVPDLPMMRKIDKFCQYNSWNTLCLQTTGKVEFSDKLHGYIENNECYDNSYFFYEKEVKQYEQSLSNRGLELSNFENKINKCIDILEKLFNRIKLYRESKNIIKRLQDLIEKGYVNTNQKLRGGKKQRRFKKNANLRYLTDNEIDEYKARIVTETGKKERLKTEIKSVVTIENMFFELKDTPKNIKVYARKLNNKHVNFGDTLYLFSILEDLIKKLDRDIYKECLVKYQEVLKVEKEEKIEKAKVAKNRTRTYIDENGVEHSLDSDIKQIIYTL
tara:strand:+ start:224 stop:1159 length:936 start_codon:yes stop_codon:yes gene_type:complete